MSIFPSVLGGEVGEMSLVNIFLACYFMVISSKIRCEYKSLIMHFHKVKRKKTFKTDSVTNVTKKCNTKMF